VAPSRPYWKGYLKLSLVSCPVAVYTATSSAERVAFRQINKQTGNRLKQQLIDEETGDVVDAADKGRGFEVAKRTYLAIEDEELDAISIESTHTIDIDSFVPRAPKSTSATLTVIIISFRRTESVRMHSP
jgi:DNA end-binding protein Ku